MTTECIVEHLGNPGSCDDALRVLVKQAAGAEAERRHHIRMMRALTEAAPAIHAAQSVEALVETAAREVCSVLGAQRAFVGVQKEPDSIGSRVGASFPPAGAAPNDLEDPMWFDSEDPNSVLPAPPGAPRARLAVPLMRRDGARFGVLRVAATPERHFEETDHDVLVQLAHLVAVAVESARLHARLQAVTRAREEFVSIVSHDLRSPLGTVQLATWQIRELCGHGPPPLEKAVRCVERSVANMNRLIENLVEVSRVDGGRLTLDLADVPVSPLLDAAIAQARPNADAASVTLSSRASAGLAPIRADRHRTLQLVSNLLVNTLKFAPSGGELQLSAEPINETVRITVRGANLTLEHEVVSSLFDQFWQSKDARYRALGLGLYVAKNIVEAHGGALDIEQQPEHGYAFHLTLPKSALPSV
jgi:signal transduction histidine kinase